MFFALLIGIGLSLTRTEAARRLEEVIEGLHDVVMRLIAMVISWRRSASQRFCSRSPRTSVWKLWSSSRATSASFGVALAIHQFVVYPLTVRFLGGMSPRFFFRPGGDDHGLLDRVVERHAADGAQSGRGEPQAPVARLALRADHRLDRQPERHGCSKE